jgi:hypothetical protein
VKPCKHQYEDHRYYFNTDDGKIHQELRCVLCGFISDGWFAVKGEEKDG